MLGTFVAGRYSATYLAVDIGISRQGFELDFMFKQEVIDETDAYGLSTIDAVLRGADGFVSAQLKEYKTGSKSILWAIGGGTLGKVFSTAIPCGAFATDLAGSLVFTSTANTSAASSPATLTAAKAFPAPNFNPKILLDSRLREVPIRMQMYPYTSGSDLVIFSTT